MCLKPNTIDLQNSIFGIAKKKTLQQRFHDDLIISTITCSVEFHQTRIRLNPFTNPHTVIQKKKNVLFLNVFNIFL